MMRRISQMCKALEQPDEPAFGIRRLQSIKPAERVSCMSSRRFKTDGVAAASFGMSLVPVALQPI